MRNIGIVVALLIVAIDAAAQDKQQGSGRRYFGAPVIKSTVLRNHTALMLGGRGGVYVTPSLLVGGGAYGTMTEVDAPPGVPFAPGPLDLKFESFGFDAEYALHPTAPTHLTLTAFFGGGALHYMKDKTNVQHGETDFMLLLEPAAGVEQRLTDGLHLNFAVSYRVVSGVEQPVLGNGDIAGAALSLAAKIGRF